MSGPFGSSQWMYASGGFYDFPISNSLRFEDGDSAYLGFTPSSAGNRKTWTWSGWIKFSNLAGNLTMLSAGTSAGEKTVVSLYGPNGSIYFANAVGGVQANYYQTTRVFRDPSAWYHIVVAVDTTQSTASNRVKIYANNELTTNLITAIPQNDDTYLNSTSAHSLGRRTDSNDNYFSGYMADTCLIDGAALTPASFGETKNDIWIPKNTAGLTFGDEGWRLEYKQVGTGTASSTTIGADTSGNDNHWTSTNLVASDVVPDSPTNNFATLNPLSKFTSNTTLAEGNLKANASNSGASNWGTTFSSIAIPSTGKYYIEGLAFINGGSGNSSHLGVLDSSSFSPSSSNITYSFTTGEGFDGIHASLYDNTVQPVADGVLGTAVTGLTATTIDVMLAVDVDAGKVWAGYNGTWLNSGDPAAGSGEIATRTFTANDVIAAGTSYNGTNDQGMFTNFGQDSSFAGAKTAQNNADGNDIGDFYYAS